mmetsp:Transcript_22395/g.50466  ORF Transcript_22395/g.50466 Transcript_22395/m.50466 type:complete len:251 (-) Transcript_22395:118-870(-)
MALLQRRAALLGDVDAVRMAVLDVAEAQEAGGRLAHSDPTPSTSDQTSFHGQVPAHVLDSTARPAPYDGQVAQSSLRGLQQHSGRARCSPHEVVRHLDHYVLNPSYPDELHPLAHSNGLPVPSCLHSYHVPVPGRVDCILYELVLPRHSENALLVCKFHRLYLFVHHRQRFGPNELQGSSETSLYPLLDLGLGCLGVPVICPQLTGRDTDGASSGQTPLPVIELEKLLKAPVSDLFGFKTPHVASRAEIS